MKVQYSSAVKLCVPTQLLSRNSPVGWLNINQNPLMLYSHEVTLMPYRCASCLTLAPNPANLPQSTL